MPKTRMRSERVRRTLSRAARTGTELERDVAMLLGKPPYDTPSNYCWNDGYFARSLRDKYGERAVDKERARQQRED